MNDRAEFEKWAEPRSFQLNRENTAYEDYVMPATDYAWKIWQAARAAGAVQERVGHTSTEDVRHCIEGTCKCDERAKTTREWGELRSEMKSAIPKLTGDDIEWLIAFIRSEIEAAQPILEVKKMTTTYRGIWPEWIESDEGKRCADFDTLVRGDFLENRLWIAFRAGLIAGQKQPIPEVAP
jgi:hypothetical protein